MRNFIFIRVMVALLGVGTTMGVSVLVANVTGGSEVRIVDWAGPNYAQDVRGFSPVAPSLLLDLVAPAARGLLPKKSPPKAVTTPVQNGPVQAPAPPADPAPVPPPAPAPAALPDLAIVMTADKDNVRPNDVVTYSIRVANRGPGTASGVVVESHVPDGTTLTGWECDGASVAAAGRDSFTCGPVASKPSHALLFGFASLPAGSEVIMRFSVKVRPGLRHNTAITNHSHTYAENADLIDSEQVTVIV